MKRALFVVLFLTPFFLAGCALDDILGNFVNESPVAVIDASPQDGPVPLTVEFNAQYSHDDGEILKYRWDFGDPYDSTPMTSPAAVHTYEEVGTYLAKLTVTDDEGAIDFQIIAIVVSNPPPVVTFSVSNSYPRAGDIVRFDASTSYDANGEITNYAWNFGDGNTGSGEQTVHSYLENGDYVVALTLTDDQGATATASHVVMVQEGGSGCSDGSCGGGDKPLAVISGLPSCGGVEVGQAFTLDGSFSRAAEPEDAIVNYYWAFGDGESKSGATVTHTYQQSGYFVVELTVTDNNGLQSTASGMVYVHEGYVSCQ
jgi:PKD repeat protein